MNDGSAGDMQEFFAVMREERLQEASAVRAFKSAVISGDLQAFVGALGQLEASFVIARAFKAASGLSAPDELRDFFRDIWERDGNRLRSAAEDDLALIGGLRALMPKYEGEGLILFRGDGWVNRSKRTYGMSWTSNSEIGRNFAESRAKRYRDGSVLLQAFAPKEAIISAPAQFDDRYQEAEYLIDRRLLRDVIVLQRYSRSGEIEAKRQERN